MNKTILGVIAGVLAVFLSGSVFANDSLESRVAALENDTAKIKVGGQLQLDAGRWFADTASAGLEDGINIRRARLGVSGDIGDGCTLQYVNSKWYAIGVNGVAFG